MERLRPERFLEIAKERQMCEFCTDSIMSDCIEDEGEFCLNCPKSKGVTHEELTAYHARIVELAQAEQEFQ